MLQVWLRYFDQHNNLLYTCSKRLSEPMPNSSSLKCEEIHKNSGNTETKNLTLACRSVLAMTDKLWVKMRLCKCLKQGGKRGMPHLK